MKFIATMGQVHVHSIDGVTVDKDSLVRIIPSMEKPIKHQGKPYALFRASPIVIP